MKILVTGSNGFIGGRLIEHLAGEGHEPVSTGRSTVPSFALPGAYVCADLTRAADCERVVQGVDAVIHCAGKAGAWGSDASYERANVDATKLLIDASREAGVKRFINISSPSIYFAYRHQFDLIESDRPAKFSNAYAATKYRAEQIVSAAHGKDFWTLSLRPRGVIGAQDRNWLPRMIEMRERGALLQPGDGKNLADFTTFQNLADAIDLALSAGPGAFGRVYNITNGTPERFWDVIENALKAVGLDGRRRRVPLALAMSVARLSEAVSRLRGVEQEPTLLPLKVGVAAYSMTLDITAAKTHLGYRPRATTAEGIAEFAAWWLGRTK